VDRYLTINDYVNGYINTVVDKIKERSGLDKITLLGVCQGGTFSVMYFCVGILKRSKILLRWWRLVNFDTEKGLLHVWGKESGLLTRSWIVTDSAGDFLNFRIPVNRPFPAYDRQVCWHV